MVKLPDSLRPGVFVHTCVVRAGAQGGGLRRAALAGQAAPGAPAGPVLVRGAEDLAPFGEGTALYEMGLAALAAGAPPSGPPPRGRITPPPSRPWPPRRGWGCW